MGWIDDAIAEFGRGMGIESLALGNERLASLAFERSGTLFLEATEGHLLIYMMRDVPARDETLALRALSLCHFRNGLPYDLSPAMKGEDRLIFIARVPEREVSLPVLENTFALLVRLHERAAG